MISLNIFTKCPNTGDPKKRMYSLLNNSGRSCLAKIMLCCILSETTSLNIKKNLWVFPNFNDDYMNSLSDEYKVSLRCQAGNSLTSRMINCLFIESKISDKTILIGSDIPSLSKETIIQSINILDDHDVVLGPSYDDGFYLIGIKDNNICNQLTNYGDLSSFRDIKNFLVSRGKKVSLLDRHKDIDEPKDLLTI